MLGGAAAEDGGEHRHGHGRLLYVMGLGAIGKGLRSLGVYFRWGFRMFFGKVFCVVVVGG